MKNDNPWFLLGILILIILLLSGPTNDEKKEGIITSSTIGIFLMLAGVVLMVTGIGVVPGVILLGLGAIIMGGGIGGFIENMLFPSKGIPTIVWVGAGLIMLFMILKNKK